MECASLTVEMTPRPRTLVLGTALALAFCGQWLLQAGSPDRPAQPPPNARAKAASTPVAGRAGAIPPHRPAGYQPGVHTGLRDYHGEPVSVSCMTCHSTRQPNLKAGVEGVVPATFHQGLKYAHANQSCLSCHDAGDYDSLRLADGRKLAFADAQKLCAQCHGPQTRDYLNGSHGGMNGYWNTAQGGRTRNTCTDCHDPHAPAYPEWKPVFAPRDAAARQQAQREAAHATSSSDHHD